MKNKKSKVQIIKEAFESGRKLTALDAWKLCRSLCLAGCIIWRSWQSTRPKTAVDSPFTRWQRK